jgi:hypothetical protein
VERTSFYNRSVVDGVDEIDFLYNNLSKFKLKYQESYYRISEPDILRPDLISYQQYKTVDFWWIIMLINGIRNPLSDLKIGMLIKIPSILDIYDFNKKYRVR